MSTLNPPSLALSNIADQRAAERLSEAAQRRLTRPDVGSSAPGRVPAPAHPAITRHRRPRTLLAVIAVLATIVVVLPFAVDAMASAAGAHTHGTFDIMIDGVTVDLDQRRFHDLHPEFHVHPGHGNRWHHHAQYPTRIFGFEPMTLTEALGAMGAELTDVAFTFDGTTHRRPEATVTVTVNDAAVDPDEHIVADGDDIDLSVDTAR